LGSACPFSHDFVVGKADDKPIESTTKTVAVSKEEIDCINWKTRGECRRHAQHKCPYRHDKTVQQAALLKQETKKRKRNDNTNHDDGSSKKQPQPLSVKVSGLSYDTTSTDVELLFQDCGRIVQLLFPTFDDSGRSKGYCGILFPSPKAVQKALEFHGHELHGRVLQVTPIAGKWYRNVRDMVDQHPKEATDENAEQEDDAAVVGEFGQKVKRRKRHGHKE
jgi:hypothetical protein